MSIIDRIVRLEAEIADADEGLELFHEGEWAPDHRDWARAERGRVAIMEEYLAFLKATSGR